MNFLWSINLKWKLNCLENTSYDVSSILSFERIYLFFLLLQSQWCKSITGFYVHPHLSNTLVTQINGEAAEYIESIPDDLLSNCFQELFSRFYPDNRAPKPKQLIRSQWFNKSFIHGSHTFIELGSSIHDIKQFAIPCSNKSVEPKILFAGEGTHERFYGTMHGAFLTGIREAKRIIQFYK